MKGGGWRVVWIGRGMHRGNESAGFFHWGSKEFEEKSREHSGSVLVVPDVARYVREMNNHGVVMIGMMRLMELGWRVFPLGMRCFGLAKGVVRGGIGEIFAVMASVELVLLRRKPYAIVLHPQLADMLIANGNREAMLSFLRSMKKLWGCKTGMFTLNVVQALDFLGGMEEDCDFICTPVNTRGYGMRREKREAEEGIMKSRIKIIGYDVTCGGTCPVDESIAYAKSLGIEMCVIR